MSVSHTHGYVCSSQPQQVLSVQMGVPLINLLPDLSKDFLEMLWISVARSDLAVLPAGMVSIAGHHTLLLRFCFVPTILK